MKKIIAFLFALIVCVGMAFAAPEGYTEYISQETISAGNSDFNHNVTWNSAEDSAVFTGNNCYLKIDNPLTNAGIGTGFSIRFYVYISSDNNSSGTYTRANGTTGVKKNGWQRLFDLSDGTSKNMFFINAGSSGHLSTVVHYLQDIEANHRSFTTVSGSYYDKWYVVELVVAPGGYGTLYVDDTPVSWYTPSSSNDNVVSVIKLLNTFNTCYIGTSIYEVNNSNADGFFFGKMKSIGIAPKAMRPLYNGTNYFYTIGFDSNGGTSVDGLSATNGKIPVSLPEPTKDNYFFEGWYTDAALTTPATAGTVMTENMTLYAKWGSHQHTWTYDSEVGKLIAYCSESKYSSQCTYQGIEHAVTLTLATNKVDLDPYILPTTGAEDSVEWSSSDKTVATVDEKGFAKALKTGTTTVKVLSKDGSGNYDTAQINVLEMCKVTFNANGGSGGGVYYVPKNSVLGVNVKVFPTATKSNAGFCGWYNGSTPVSASNVITSDVTYTAKWGSGIQFHVDCLYNNGTEGVYLASNDSKNGWTVYQGLKITLVYENNVPRLKFDNYGDVYYVDIKYSGTFPGVKVATASVGICDGTEGRQMVIVDSIYAKLINEGDSCEVWQEATCFINDGNPNSEFVYYGDAVDNTTK